MHHPLLDALRVRLLARRNAVRTIDTYLTLAGEFLDGLGPRPPTREDVERFLARPKADGHTRAVSSFNQALSALRVLGSVAVEGGVWPTNPTAGIPMLKVPASDPNFLDRDELVAMFRAAASLESTHARARELALMAVLTTTGLRVHEVHALNIEQVERARGRLTGVLGKGGSRHHMALPPSALILLHDWLVHREALAPKDERGLFVSDTGRRWSIRTLQRHVGALAVRAGLARRVAPHALRHTVGTLGVAAGIDLASLSDLLRHGDTDVTKRYVHLAGERKRAAAELLDALIPPDVLPLRTSSQAPLVHSDPPLDVTVHAPRC